jgi:CHAT domain-containing protein
MPVQLLHLSLVPQGETQIELRYFFDNPNDYLPRSLPRQAIAELLAAAETDYYVPTALQALVGTGKQLYQWLDGSDRWLERTLGQSPEGMVLAIAAEAALAHLPWELLHDGTSFLVQRVPAVVPLRWVSVLGGRTLNQLQRQDQPQNRALNLMFMATSPQGVAPVLNFEREESRILEATQRHPLSLLVEESGTLEGLGLALKAYGSKHFDGLHLTGHATLEGGQPRFVMETETGEPAYVGAADIAETLQGCLPPLLFLSGCRTGQGVQAGAVPQWRRRCWPGGQLPCWAGAKTCSTPTRPKLPPSSMAN